MNQTDLSVLSTEIAFDQTSIVLTSALLTEKIFLFINFKVYFLYEKAYNCNLIILPYDSIFLRRSQIPTTFPR